MVELYVGTGMLDTKNVDEQWVECHSIMHYLERWKD